MNGSGRRKKLYGLGALLAMLLAGGCTPAYTQRVEIGGIMDSGGPLLAEQAAYDVGFYDLDLRVRPETESIEGSLTMHAVIMARTAWVVMDLDTVLAVAGVETAAGDAWAAAAWENRGGKLWIRLPAEAAPGARVRVRVRYGGRPRRAAQPPWMGGFTWAGARGGRPWIATSVQGEGADLWWPCKDHPSDEPDSFAIRITAPQPLVAASNGRLRGVEMHGDSTVTYRWFVSTPINNYGVALSIGPYRVLEGTYESVAGETLPVYFWALPEHYERARKLFPQLAEHLAFYEKYLGPYPFRADKYGVAETPFLGMEHQTLIAYGSNFENEEAGYDWLHHHELGHEWWGNLVTAADWKDFWIHEGFCTYMQALYSEELQGREGYLRELMGYRPALANERPVAPEGARTTNQMYFSDLSTGKTDNDIYYKGAWVLHTLRGLVGDEVFFQSLRRMAYPTPEMERITTGAQTRFASTDDYIALVSRLAGADLGWFFRVYLRQPELPELRVSASRGVLTLAWRTPGNLPFPMPVEVLVGGALRRVDMAGGKARLEVGDAAYTVDPNHWLLKQ